MKQIIIAILFFGCISPVLIAVDQTELKNNLSEIESVRSEIQKSTASFLLISKQLNNGEDTAHQTEQFVQITNIGAEVRETDLETSAVLAGVLEGDEFPLVEQRNDWNRINLGDGREGWIHREDVQIIERGNAASIPVAADPRVRQMAEQLYENIQDHYEQAEKLFDEFDGIYDELSSGDKTEVSSVHSIYLNEKEKIQTYRVYANHYYEKIQEIQPTPLATTAGGQEIGYQGTASIRLGTSSFESATEQSATSRNLNLNGSVIFSPRSTLNVNISHNNDVVQTPYTSNDLNLNFQHQTQGGTRLRGSVLYNSYNDKALERNNFQNVGVGANINHPLNENTRIFGDVQANSKSFDIEGGNEFDGAAFNSGLNHDGGKMQTSIGVRGRVQNSDVSFLDYFRVIPNANIRWLTSGGSIEIRAEAEQLAYAAEAEGNNFNRGRLDLLWNSQSSSTSLIAIVKQFPNNETFDNYRLRLQNEWRRISGGGSARTALSVQYVYHPHINTQLTNYIDLRIDRNSTGEKAYFDLNLFGRYWEETDRDHRVDLFSRFGLKFSQFQLGPAIGAQLLLNQNDLQIERNGNSFRAGIDARANTVIQQATVYGNLRFQKSLVYNNALSVDRDTGLVTQGEIETRLPTTIQFSAGAQVPIMDLFDLNIDVSYYNIDLDLSDKISINPVGKRTGLRVLAGVSYRFNKQQFIR